MEVIFVMGIFWTLYGIAGLLGHQNIPAKYKGHTWTKDIIRCQGKTWLMLGVPWILLYLAATFFFVDLNIKMGTWILIAALATVPGLVYTVIWEQKYKRLLAEEASDKL